jgi:hypothetical protein
VRRRPRGARHLRPAARARRSSSSATCSPTSEHFIDNARAWLDELAQGARGERDALERAVAAERAHLAKLERRAEGFRQQAQRMAERDENHLADRALRFVDDTEDAIAAQEDVAQAAEARLAEWTTPPDVDAALCGSKPRRAHETTAPEGEKRTVATA